MRADGTDKSIRLCDMRQGAGGTVLAAAGGSAFRKRIAMLGVGPGAHVSVLQNHGRGPVLILVHDLRLALGRGEAAKVLVEVSLDRDHGCT